MQPLKSTFLFSSFDELKWCILSNWSSVRYILLYRLRTLLKLNALFSHIYIKKKQRGRTISNLLQTNTSFKDLSAVLSIWELNLTKMKFFWLLADCLLLESQTYIKTQLKFLKWLQQNTGNTGNTAHLFISEF